MQGSLTGRAGSGRQGAGAQVEESLPCEPDRVSEERTL